MIVSVLVSSSFFICHSTNIDGSKACLNKRFLYIIRLQLPPDAVPPMLHVMRSFPDLGLYSLSGKTSHRKISWSLEAARFGFKLVQSLWNLAGTSAALLPRCLSNFRAIRPLQHTISRLRDFTRFGGKTSYRLVNRGPEYPSCVFRKLQK